MVAEARITTPVSGTEEDLSWLLDAERGSVAVNRDGIYVRGSETIYCVTLDPDTCECAWNTHKHAECFHIRAARDHFRKADPCPVCHGEGVLTPNGSVIFIGRDGRPDMKPIPRACCSGQGTRTAWIEGGRLGVVRVAGMTEEERKALFR